MPDETGPPMTRERMRADLARSVRLPPEEIGDDDELSDLGLDSMRAMALVTHWATQGLDLDFAELSEELTLNAWWAAAERAMARARG